MLTFLPDNNFSRDKPIILCVDDEETNLAILGDFLSTEYQLILVSEPGQAIALIKEYQPTLILLDIMMPDINGYTLAKRIHNLEHFEQIPIIFVTALSSTLNEEKGFELGCLDYITKPYSPKILQARISLHLKLLSQQEQINKQMQHSKETEAILSHSRQRLENIMNSLPGVVYQFQAIQGRLSFQFISDNIQEFHALKPHDVLSDFNAFINSIYPEDQAGVNDVINQSIKYQLPMLCEYRVIDKKRNVRWIRMEAKVKQLAVKDNDVLLFSESSSQIDKQINGNLTDITEAKIANEIVLQQRKELTEINQHTEDSIKYASLIQSALIPTQNDFDVFFKDNFIIWEPKDIVGGDIYLFEHLRNEDECLLMLIDCTGHGVPGAFVTMLVKAIANQITSKIIKNTSEVSPAEILSFFNRKMKLLLKQQSKSSISNAGFDGSILYFNKKQRVIKYSGAQIPFIAIRDQQLELIKGDRHSIGYKTSDANYQFKEHEIVLSKDLIIYLVSDGYQDQNGGAKGYSLGRKKLLNLLCENHQKPMPEQKQILLNALQNYQGKYSRNDDISVIGLRL